MEGICSSEVEVDTTLRHLDLTGNNMILVPFASVFMAPLHIKHLFDICILCQIPWQSLIVNCLQISLLSGNSHSDKFQISWLKYFHDFHARKLPWTSRRADDEQEGQTWDGLMEWRRMQRSWEPGTGGPGPEIGMIGGGFLSPPRSCMGCSAWEWSEVKWSEIFSRHSISDLSLMWQNSNSST